MSHAISSWIAVPSFPQRGESSVIFAGDRTRLKLQRATVLTADMLSSGLMLLRSSRDIENEMIFRPGRDPDKPPPREPGDAIVVTAMFIGAAVGFLSGAALAHFGGIGTIFINSAVGAIGLALAGTFVGDRIKKSRRRIMSAVTARTYDRSR